MWRLPLAYWVAAAGLSAAILSTPETGPEEVRATIRATAFTSAIPFLAAFMASSLHKLFRTTATRWLLANRRYVGLCVAASHFWHLVAIVLFVQLYVTEPLNRLTLVFGSAGFVFLGLMAATSTDGAQRALGVWWKWLHKTGMYVVWLDFIFTYMGPATISPFHTVMTLAFGIAWAVRLAAFWRA